MRISDWSSDVCSSDLLKKREFAVLQGKKFLSTERARDFVKIIREDGNRFADVIATADLERELRQVEKDPSQAAAIWGRFTAQLREEIAKLKAGPAPRKLPPNPRSSGGYSGGNKTGSGGRAYSKSKGKSSSYSSGNG